MFERIKSPQRIYGGTPVYYILLLYYTYAIQILENACAFYGGNTKPF